MWVVRTASKAVTLAGVAVAAVACATAQPTVAVLPTGTATPAQGAAVPVAADPRVGALFLGGGSIHTCSAAVLDSTAGDLILTAAHCLVDGVDTTFVPGFRADSDDADGSDQVWRVTAAYLDPRWLADQQPQTDFAIVRVSGDGAGSLQQRAGGGLSLGSAPAAGSAVTVTGYPMGDGGPLACRGVTAVSPQGFPSLPCAGLTDGFSGAPWVAGTTVTGLVGGLDGGGCDDDVSYSPRLDDGILRLLTRAEAGGPGDAAPTAFGTGC